MKRTMMFAMAGALLSTGVSANVLECRVPGALVGEVTLNMNFETWHSEGDDGDLEKVGPRTYRWRMADGETFTAVFSRNGRSARVTATGEGEKASGSCRFITTGRTKGP